MRKNMLLLALFSLGVSLQINQLIAMKEQPPSYEELYGPQEPAPGYEEELPAEE